MKKQTLWIKRRTSRGGGRAVQRRERLSAKNIDRDVRKNQLVYSRYLLKFVLMFALGLLWVRLGVAVGPIAALPVGVVAGLLIISLEKLQSTKWIELGILLTAGVLSFVFPVGLII